MTPTDKILAETDESQLSIDAIIMRLEESAQKPLREVIIENGKIFKVGRFPNLPPDSL